MFERIHKWYFYGTITQIRENDFSKYCHMTDLQTFGSKYSVNNPLSYQKIFSYQKIKRRSSSHNIHIHSVIYINIAVYNMMALLYIRVSLIYMKNF